MVILLSAIGAIVDFHDLFQNHHMLLRSHIERDSMRFH